MDSLGNPISSLTVLRDGSKFILENAEEIIKDIGDAGGRVGKEFGPILITTTATVSTAYVTSGASLGTRVLSTSCAVYGGRKAGEALSGFTEDVGKGVAITLIAAPLVLTAAVVNETSNRISDFISLFESRDG